MRHALWVGNTGTVLWMMSLSLAGAAGLIGLGVDAASGAINEYEPGVEIQMTPIKGCLSAPAA
jgi:hypothetical protein